MCYVFILGEGHGPGWGLAGAWGRWEKGSGVPPPKPVPHHNSTLHPYFRPGPHAARRPAYDTSYRKDRHWFAPPPARLAARVVVPASPTGAFTLHTRLASPGLAYLWQHVLKGRPLLPGAAMLEAVRAAAGAACDGAGRG